MKEECLQGAVSRLDRLDAHSGKPIRLSGHLPDQLDRSLVHLLSNSLHSRHFHSWRTQDGRRLGLRTSLDRRRSWNRIRHRRDLRISNWYWRRKSHKPKVQEANGSAGKSLSQVRADRDFSLRLDATAR